MESIRLKANGGAVELYSSAGMVNVTIEGTVEGTDVKAYVSLSPDMAFKLAQHITRLATDEVVKLIGAALVVIKEAKGE